MSDRRCAMCGEPCEGGRNTLAGCPPEHEFHLACLPPLSVAQAQTIIDLMRPGSYVANAAAIETSRAEWFTRYYEKHARA